MKSVTFHVPGKPQGKARAKTVRNKHTGNTMSYTPEKDLLYENYIKNQFLNACGGMFLEQGKPVTLRIVARFSPPKSTSKKRAALMLEGKELPLKKPDVDNIVKVVADALNGVAYHDDTQIVLVAAKKAYSAIELLELTIQVDEYIEAIGKSELRIIFRLYFLDDLSYPKVADQMNQRFPKRQIKYTDENIRKKIQRYFENVPQCPDKK